MDIWKTQPSSEGQIVHWAIGPLDLWVKPTAGEWQVAAERGEERDVATVDAVDPAPNAEWRRWAASLEAPALKLTPLLPDLPVIVRPADPIHILPAQEAQFFVGIPMWVRLSVIAADKEEQEMCQEHTVQLSRSWFGTPQEGELCYALRSRARRSFEDLTPAPHRIVCPLLLRNGSNSALLFERLCLRVPHLAVFQGKDHLWANEGRVTFKGEEAPSRIDYGSGPPAFDGASTMLGAAREHAEKGLMAKTFGNLRSFSLF